MIRPFVLPIALLGAPIVSCGGDAAQLAGEYALTRIGETPLPTTVCSTELGSMEALSGRLSVADDLEYELGVEFRQTGEGHTAPATLRDRGRVQIEREAVRFQSASFAQTWDGTRTSTD